jgi:hypothetical protein
MKTKCTFIIVSPSVLLRMRNVSDKSCRQNQSEHFKFNNFSENCVVYGKMWKHIVDSYRPQTTIRRMRFACRTTKATSTYLEYVLLIAFPRQ